MANAVQEYRFIGGINHMKFLAVAEGATVVRNWWDGHYRRERIVMSDDVARYEETVYVDSTLTLKEAELMLREYARLGKSALRMPKPPVEKTTPLLTKASSLVKGLGYNHEKMLLDVTFKNGVTYRYSGVGYSALGRLLTADSLGAAYGKHIRNQFPCEKLDAPASQNDLQAAVLKAHKALQRKTQKGDFVECIKHYPAGGWLTKGKKYEVLNLTERHVYVRGDNGLQGGFSLSDGYLDIVR